MVEVKNLTKFYGSIKAVDDISFTVETGEVLGFLGPNGAGKSTTMNMITGYLSSTSGTVTIDGCEILDDPIHAKSKIGYLPEIPPLYIDMTVKKYLEFMFDLKKVKLPKKEHIDEEGNDHGGTMKIDATCCDAEVRYPTDCNLLEDGSNLIDRLLNKFCARYKIMKPRTHRVESRQAFILLTKKKDRKSVV